MRSRIKDEAFVCWGVRSCGVGSPAAAVFPSFRGDPAGRRPFALFARRFVPVRTRTWAVRASVASSVPAPRPPFPFSRIVPLRRDDRPVRAGLSRVNQKVWGNPIRTLPAADANRIAAQNSSITEVAFNDSYRIGTRYPAQKTCRNTTTADLFDPADRGRPQWLMQAPDAASRAFGHNKAAVAVVTAQGSDPIRMNRRHLFRRYTTHRDGSIRQAPPKRAHRPHSTA